MVLKTVPKEEGQTFLKAKVFSLPQHIVGEIMVQSFDFFPNFFAGK